MAYLRVVLLQDAAVLIPQMPELCAWQHPVFRSQAFARFQEELAGAMELAVDPANATLEVAMPAMNAKVEDLRRMVAAQTALIQGQAQELKAIRKAVEEGQFIITSTIRPGPPPAAAQGPADPVVPRRVPAAARMSRAAGMTISTLWEEWTVGLGGAPPIRDAERAGTQWRRHPTEARFFQRRKIIIDEVQRRIDAGSGAVDAVRALEDEYAGKELNAIAVALKPQRDGQ
jgi:hypothetical protein